MTSASLMHEAGPSKLVLGDNSEGWGGQGVWRGIQDGETHVHPLLIHVNVWQKPPQYCKAIVLQLQEINELKKRERDTQESSPTPQQKGNNFQHSAFFMVQLSHLFMTTAKTIALTLQTFVDKVSAF